MNEIEILEQIQSLERRIKILESKEHSHPIVKLGTPTELTIASGVVTRTQGYHTIDTQGDAASDDLDTINGGIVGDVLIIRAVNSGRVVTVKDSTGNIELSADMVLDNVQDTLTLIYDGSNWLELSRSDNTTGV